MGGQRGYRAGPLGGKIFPSGNLRRTSAESRAGVTAFVNEAGGSGGHVSHSSAEQFVVVKLHSRWVEDGEQKRGEHRGDRVAEQRCDRGRSSEMKVGELFT